MKTLKIVENENQVANFLNMDSIKHIRLDFKELKLIIIDVDGCVHNMGASHKLLAEFENYFNKETIYICEKGVIDLSGGESE